MIQIVQFMKFQKTLFLRQPCTPSRQGCFYDHPEGRMIDNVHLADVGEPCLNLCRHSVVRLKKDGKKGSSR